MEMGGYVNFFHGDQVLDRIPYYLGGCQYNIILYHARFEFIWEFLYQMMLKSILETCDLCAISSFYFYN